MSRPLPPSFPFTLAGSLLTRLPPAPLCQQVSQTPVLSQTKIQASLLEESVTSGTEWPLAGRRWSLFCVVLGQLGESHESVSAEGNWSPTFQVFPAFQRSLAHGRLGGGMLRGLSQPRLLRESPGQLVLAAPGGPKAEAKGNCPEFLSQHPLVPRNRHKHHRGGHSRKHGQTSEGIDGKASLSGQRGGGPGFAGQRPAGTCACNGLQERQSQAASCPLVEAARQLQRLVKPCSGHSPAACQVSPTGAWEQQPRQTQTGVRFVTGAGK